MADKHQNSSLIDYSSIKPRKNVRSVLGAETFSNVAIVIEHDLKQIINRRIKIKILTHIETLFNVIIRNASTTEDDQ